MVKKVWLACRRILFIALILILLWHLYVFGCVLLWKWVSPWSTAFMRQQESALHVDKPDTEIAYQWVDYNKISVNLKSAVIASEDDKFIDHDGFDWDSIEKAAKKNSKNAKKIIGGSTISQQLAKNLFLSPSRSYIRKVEEAIITFVIESLWSKERILEVYLNVAEWGIGVFGAEAAAQHYFHKSAARLSRQQAAKLASMLPQPRYYDANPRDRRLAWKTKLILRRMSAARLPTTDETD